MPVERAVVERALAQVNAGRPRGLEARLESFSPPGRFVLSFPPRAMPEGQCIDQDFTDVQFLLLERDSVTTGIQSGRFDDESQRYWIEYDVVEWD
ncbi:MAG TPA: hypothetical protein VHH36_01015 [Candidatus Thermoplasmatota archaeon]|nr:hypothetical protein [Candidatus Thermoplasmatota archaeon]